MYASKLTQHCHINQHVEIEKKQKNIWGKESQIARKMKNASSNHDLFTRQYIGLEFCSLDQS